jgi:branched-chain amino acid transport system ATP-binding protein
MSIEILDVEAGYVRDVPIVQGVTLCLDDGEILTVLGPNGSGKSTLLKAVIGAVPLSAGEVRVDGRSVGGVPIHRRATKHGLAYVPQLDNVFGPLTVHENLDIGGVQLPRTERRRRIDELAAMYPVIRERLSQRADSLSGGERQILTIARALMTRPRYLLLDEPSAGLSPLMAEQLFSMLSDVRRQQDVTVLLVEQNAVLSLDISDQGAVLVAGRVVLKAPAQDMLADDRLSEVYLGGTLTGEVSAPSQAGIEPPSPAHVASWSPQLDQLRQVRKKRRTIR